MIITTIYIVNDTLQCYFGPVGWRGLSNTPTASLQRAKTPPTSVSPSRMGLRITPNASLHRGKTPTRKVLIYDTTQSDAEVPLMLDLWVMWSIPSLPSLPGHLRPGVVAPDRVPSMVKRTKLCIYAKLKCLK